MLAKALTGPNPVAIIIPIKKLNLKTLAYLFFIISRIGSLCRLGRQRIQDPPKRFRAGPIPATTSPRSEAERLSRNV